MPQAYAANAVFLGRACNYLPFVLNNPPWLGTNGRAKFFYLMRTRLCSLVLLICSCGAGHQLHAELRQARVFVALCDNKTQGIVPVGAKIGNGDDPDANLYWGCSDGLGSYFQRSAQWRVVSKESDVSESVLRRLSLRHEKGDVELVAEAYRGSHMRQCLTDFEQAAASGKYDLVAFIGHNALMDFQLAPPKAIAGNQTEVVVLCCLSEKFFDERLRQLGCRPLLMTKQLMYPGSFLLDAAIEKWRTGGTHLQIREAAAAAYARNQKISTRAALGVFAEIKQAD